MTDDNVNNFDESLLDSGKVSVNKYVNYLISNGYNCLAVGIIFRNTKTKTMPKTIHPLRFARRPSLRWNSQLQPNSSPLTCGEPKC